MWVNEKRSSLAPAQRLGRPGLEPLVDELARRFGEGTLPVQLTLRDLQLTERLILADLFGRDRMPDPTARVRVSQLIGALGLDSVEALRAAVEELRGPLPDRRAERQAHRSARDELWSWLEAEALSVPLFGRIPGAVPAWVERVRIQGPRGGVDAHRQRLELALRVLRALPADGVPLAGFAADLAGDPHALDRGRRVAALVLDAVALAAGAPPSTGAESTRDLWEGVGVAPDPLSSTVLALGLSGHGVPDPLGPWLDAAREAGEPVVLTLAQLRRWPLAPLASQGRAYVVENPSLVAEAARMGWSGRPPLICSSGRPTVAVVTLLRQLGAKGGTLNQHADFDPAGLAITAWLAERAGTTPWRMTASDYARAAGPCPERRAGLGPGHPATPHDHELRRAMRREGVAVYEEELRERLLASME
ncbi:MAG: TIGR02679 family protein [Acidimicrobiales bacterium]